MFIVSKLCRVSPDGFHNLDSPENCDLAQHNFGIFPRLHNFCGGVQFSHSFGYFCQFWGGLITNCFELWLLDTAVVYVWSIYKLVILYTTGDNNTLCITVHSLKLKITNHCQLGLLNVHCTIIKSKTYVLNWFIFMYRPGVSSVRQEAVHLTTWNPIVWNIWRKQIHLKTSSSKLITCILLLQKQLLSYYVFM